MRNSWKKTAAFVLAFTLVAAPLTQTGSKGGLFGATGIVAHAAAYTITLPNAENGSVSATVGESIATSADSGATVTLTANPANGYKLKSISGTYKGNPHEDKSLNGTKNITGTYFNYTATDAAGAGWKLANNSSITISSSSKTITKVEFNISQRGNSFSLNNVNCSAGTKSLSGNTLSLSSVNSKSLTLSQSVNNAGYVRFNSVKVYYDGDETLKISGTGTSNVYTFTMPESNVTLSAEFEEDNTAVTGVTLNPSDAQTIEVNGKVSFTANVAPDNATDKTVKWSVGGTDASAVKLYTDEACTTEVGADATETLTVYAKGISAGSATVTATSNADSEKKASCDVTVNAAQTQTEELLTTITATGKEQASFSTENVANVSFSYSAQGSSNYYNKGTTNWGWWGYGWTATVTPVEGYTITKCVFYDDANRSATDSEAPFVVETTEEDKTPQVNGTPILAYTSKGITKIEVYGYATPTTSAVELTADNVTIDDFTYDGTEKTPVLKYGDTTLLKDTDYELLTTEGDTASATNAGTYTIHINGKGDYAGENISLTWKINKADVNVTADAKSKKYGEDDPVLTYTAGALFGTDAFTGALARAEGEAPLVIITISTSPAQTSR